VLFLGGAHSCLFRNPKRSPVRLGAPRSLPVLKTALSSENDPHVDLHDRWLSVLPPRSVEWKREQKRPRAVRLKDIEDPVVADKVSTHELTRLAQAVEREQSVGRRLTQQSSAFLARRRSDRRELLKSADVAASWEAKAHSRDPDGMLWCRGMYASIQHRCATAPPSLRETAPNPDRIYRSFGGRPRLRRPAER
jgi:hypothetical protein